jgi:biotin carboxylase
MKKLMVLGAGYPQVLLMKAAKELGYKTIVASIPGDYPGFEEADEICYADISKPEEVYQEAQRLQIDGIATCCLDTGVKSIGYVCERMGLCGLSEKAATLSANKLLMKEAFMKEGVSTAKFVKVSNEESLKEAFEILEFPVIVKAVDLQGSKGIYIARTKQEAIDGFHEAMKLTRENFCIIEEYIEGNEFGAQAFVYKGEVIFVLPHGDNTYMSHTAVPVGHYVPLDKEKTILDQAIVEAKKAIRAIGLDNCAVNIDLIEKNGKVYMIELTGRVGATCLPELVSIYYGIDYYKMIVQMAMNENPLEIFEQKSDKRTANASRMLLSEQSGIVKEIKNEAVLDDSVYDFSLIIEKGSRVEKFTNAKDRIGQIIVKADTLEECENKIQEVMEKCQIIFE